MKYQFLFLAGFGLLLIGVISKNNPDSVQGNQTKMEEIIRQEKNIWAKSLGQNIQHSEREGERKTKSERLMHKKSPKENLLINKGPTFQEKARTVLIEIVPELMKYDTDTFTVKAGEKIMLELDNLDGMQHNLLILKPGSLEKVGAAADAMLRDPRASEKNYVPEIPEVLFATEMLGPGDLYTLEFIVPDTAGDYPFVCTFPGHWRMMNGIMRVEAQN